MNKGINLFCSHQTNQHGYSSLSSRGLEENQKSSIFSSVGLYSLSHGVYGSNVQLQYVITANKAHNTENMATIAFKIHHKMTPAALCPQPSLIFIDGYISFCISQYKLQLKHALSSQQ